MTDAPLRYTYRQSILTQPWTFSLEDNALLWQEEGKPSIIKIALNDISSVQPVFDPTRVQLNRYVLNLKTTNGKTIKLASTSYKGISDFEDQAASYTPFVQALHAQLAKANPSALFVKGISKTGYFFSFLVLIFLALLFVIGGLLLLNGVTHPVIFIKLVLLLFFIPALWRYLKCNKPGTYDPMNLPANILPQA
jgi:hypothetical protein